MVQRGWRVPGGSSPISLRTTAVADLRSAEKHWSLQKESTKRHHGKNLFGAQEKSGIYDYPEVQFAKCEDNIFFSRKEDPILVEITNNILAKSYIRIVCCRQARRAVMDLPTTDPGSDLCDLTDSADESFVKSEGREYDGTSNNIKIFILTYAISCMCVLCSCLEKYAGISRGDNRTLREGDDREGGATGEDADLTGNHETSQRVFRGVTTAQGSPEDSPTAAMSSVRVNNSSTKDRKNS